MDQLYQTYENGQPGYLRGNDAKFRVDSDGFTTLKDPRAFQHSSLQVIYYFFAKLHDRIVEGLKLICPSLTEDQRWHRAMQLNIHLYQSLIFNELIEVVIGKTTVDSRGLRPTGPSFNPSTLPTCLADFASGVGRVLHRYVPGK